MSVPSDDPKRIRCHYDVLQVSRDATLDVIKKQYRTLALKHHPDKNIGNDAEAAAEQFRLIQQAYECLSDVQERKWYDDHRDAILAGWTAGGENNNNNSGNNETGYNMTVQVAPYMYAGCYSGYHDQEGGFYHVYSNVFSNIVACERKQDEVLVELPTEFGNDQTEWSEIVTFYQAWESFSSVLNFAWEDKYNIHEDAPDRRIRRLMDDDNKKARRKAKKTYNQDILALVAFVKRRDPRVQAKKAELEKQRLDQEKKLQRQAAERKQEQKRAKEAWREQALQEMEAAEEEDRLAGRVRLADLDDDYDYGGGGKKKKGKGKKKKKKNSMQDELESETENNDSKIMENDEQYVLQLNEENPKEVNDALTDDDDGSVGVDESIDTLPNAQIEDDAEEVDHDDEPESEEEPEVWRCECCRKDFKSEGQMENHMKSKKHKEAFKKYQAKMSKKEEKIMNEMMDEMMLDE